MRKKVSIIEILNLILMLISTVFLGIGSLAIANNSNKIAEKEFMPNIVLNSTLEFNQETQYYDTEKLYIRNYGYKIMDFKFSSKLICTIDIVCNNKIYAKKLLFNEYFMGNGYINDMETLGYSYCPQNNYNYYKYIKKIEEMLKTKNNKIFAINFSRMNYSKIEYKDSFGKENLKFYKGDSINIKEITIKQWEEEVKTEKEYIIYSEEDIEHVVEKILSELVN